jgi:hypothetical protein
MSGECESCGEHCLECNCMSDAQGCARVQWFFDHLQNIRRDTEEWILQCEKKKDPDSLDNIDKECAQSRLRIIEDLIEEYYLAFEAIIYNRDP